MKTIFFCVCRNIVQHTKKANNWRCSFYRVTQRAGLTLKTAMSLASDSGEFPNKQGHNVKHRETFQSKPERCQYHFHVLIILLYQHRIQTIFCKRKLPNSKRQKKIKSFLQSISKPNIHKEVQLWDAWEKPRSTNLAEQRFKWMISGNHIKAVNSRCLALIKPTRQQVKTTFGSLHLHIHWNVMLRLNFLEYN